MADESQVSLLKRGVTFWNEWRHENELVVPQLLNADFRYANLSKVDLHGANLSHSDLSGANLSEANLSNAKLLHANLFLANLNLSNLSGADLSRAKLSDVDQYGWIQAGSGTKLRGADLSRTKMWGANLDGADLSKVNLSGAFMFRASLCSAVLDGANFQDAIVGGTSFGDVDLSSCSGLDSVRHLGPSTLGVASIIQSKGRIPEVFLRGIGLPDEWIRSIRSHGGDGIQFFSCFISYSSSDKPFAVRLHDTLQSKGVRCWLDEKQLFPGDDISRELERGIYLWDKFLLCASKNSLTSWWVEDEIKTTLEKERALRKERGKPVHKLIPLNLDGYMFTGEWDLGVLANEIRSRVAGDFRDWEKPNSNFSQQVDRVIKALRADEGAREQPPPSKL